MGGGSYLQRFNFLKKISALIIVKSIKLKKLLDQVCLCQPTPTDLQVYGQV